MNDDLEPIPTPEEKAAADAVLDNPDYLAEPDDTSTIDDPIEEGDAA